MNKHLKLSLQKTLDIEACEEFYKNNQIIDGVEKIIIDASEIEQIDTAGLQMLLHYVTTCNAKQINIEWLSPISDPFIEKARRGGFVDALCIISGEQ